MSSDYLSFISPDYLDELEKIYRENPKSLPLTWQIFFDGKSVGEEYSEDFHPQTNGNGHLTKDTASDTQDSSVVDELKITNLIEAYRRRGHLAAQIDPLGQHQPDYPPHLNLNFFGLDKAIDVNKKYHAAQLIGLKPTSLNSIVDHLQKTYCQDIGVEFSHLADENAKLWLQQKMELTQNKTSFSKEQKLAILRDLNQAENFEDFLQKNYTGQKRFSVEGGESVIPGLHHIIDSCSKLGASEIIIGMAHRGRLNVLVNVLKKAYDDVITEFEGNYTKDSFTGDVKYHLGYSNDVDYGGRKVHLTLAFNPSHLEVANPVVEGMVRAKQDHDFGGNRNKIVPLIIHGDAAVVGQGIVTETLNLSNLEGYKTGGTIHLVINNQVGFTTSPHDSRSSLYCTSFAQAIQAPVFHVNGNKVESVIHAVNLATEFRMKFNRDVFIDVYCYRKYGHNEGDEPRFTQPLMYNLISKLKSPYAEYAEKLEAEGVIDSTYKKNLTQGFLTDLNERLQKRRVEPKPIVVESMGGKWSGLITATYKNMCEFYETPMSEIAYNQILDLIHKVPEGFTPLPKYQKMLEARYQKVLKDGQIDWAIGEQLAFGSLLLENHSIRLSGQDAKRGTFSHRHIEITDSINNNTVMLLKKLETNAKLEVYNSPLSEYGVLGFDFGYSLSQPNTLTIWEAQFGDFANTAQVIIDQFISASEFKWSRMSGLTMLLPHGFEGQGPEHSSARLERYLQLCANSNMQVCYPTTPSQLFHLLRRQLKRPFRKPLIVMSPKSPLRMPEVISNKLEFFKGGFKNYLLDKVPVNQCEKVILCSGKVYWDLIKRAKEIGMDQKITFIRIEQLYPLDKSFLIEMYKEYNNVKKWCYVQEEPQNMGAWNFFAMKTQDIGWKLEYIGRDESPSVATGSSKIHVKEVEELMTKAVS